MNPVAALECPWELVPANKWVGCHEVHARFSSIVTMFEIKVPKFVLTKLTFVAENVLHLLQHTVDIFL